MASHNELGKQGELLAQQYLRKQGYTIVQTNWRCGNLEVDIIARKRKEIVFIEVKTRQSATFISPEEAVDLRRKKRLTQAANIYIQQNNVSLSPRFDIIAIILPNEKEQPIITHFADAFPAIATYY